MIKKFVIYFCVIIIVTPLVYSQEETPDKIVYDYSHFYGILSPFFDGGNIIEADNITEFELYQPLRVYGIINLYAHSLRIEPSVTMVNVDTNVLADVDILVIRTPFLRRGFSRFYSDNEAEIIKNFVSGGGSLLVLSDGGGDSYNNTNLNTIVNKFGIQFNDDFVISREHAAAQEVKFQLNKTKLNRIKVFNVCSIGIDNPRAEDKIIWSDKNSLLMTKEFFNGKSIDTKISDFLAGNIHKEPSSYPIGIFREYGEGRVIALGSSCLLPFLHFFWDILESDNIDFLFHATRWLQQREEDGIIPGDMTNLRKRADFFRKKASMLLDAAQRYGIDVTPCEKNLDYSKEYFERGNFYEAISYAKYSEEELKRQRTNYHETRKYRVLVGTLFIIVVIYHTLWGLTRIRFMLRGKIKLGVSICSILFFLSGFSIQGWGVIYSAPVFFLWAGTLIFFHGNLLEKLFRSSVLAALVWLLIFPGLFTPNPLKYPAFLYRSIDMTKRIKPSHFLIKDMIQTLNTIVPPETSSTDKAIMVESFVNQIIANKSYFSLLSVARYVPTINEMLGWGGAQSEKNIVTVSMLKNMGFDKSYLSFGFPFKSYPHSWATVEVEGKTLELGTPDYTARDKTFLLDNETIYWMQSPGIAFTRGLFLNYPPQGLFLYVILVVFLTGFASIYWDGDLGGKGIKLIGLISITIVVSLILYGLFNLNVTKLPEISEVDSSIKFSRSPFILLIFVCWSITFMFSRITNRLAGRMKD